MPTRIRGMFVLQDLKPVLETTASLVMRGDLPSIKKAFSSEWEAGAQFCDTSYSPDDIILKLSPRE